jgi:hypothetical protein
MTLIHQCDLNAHKTTAWEHDSAAAVAGHAYAMFRILLESLNSYSCKQSAKGIVLESHYTQQNDLRIMSWFDLVIRTCP